ncbi:hypothetical protein KSP40_PGU010370 [Platanthera guangdongensis]|uniref:Uncharacterized protein n=1 Tax=Platanthera guangdongensis TaxID=2320717 RepID=A0ABR2MYX7_9ASPA
MQEPQVSSQEENPRPKACQKKPPGSAKKGEVEKGSGGLTSSLKPKNSKGSQKPDSSESFHGIDGCASDSFPDCSSYSGDYRVLRHQYLLLEEESVSLDRELSIVEFEITDLEKEKFGLLDQLVVLEGLVEPSALKPKGGF